MFVDVSSVRGPGPGSELVPPLSRQAEADQGVTRGGLRVLSTRRKRDKTAEVKQVDSKNKENVKYKSCCTIT